MLTANKHAWKREYKKFMVETDVDEVGGILEGKKWPSFLGSKEFAGWVKGKFYASKRGDEIPQTRELAPETERIVKLVSDFYNVKEENLYISKRGFFNEPRNVAIYLVLCQNLFLG